MVNSPDVQHAASLSRLYPGLQIDLHFVLTHGHPLTAMSSLVNERGELGKWLWERAESGLLSMDEIHHVHMLPQIYPLVEAFAQSRSIPLRIGRQEVERQDIPLRYDRSTEWFDAGFYGEAISEALFLQVLDRADKRGAKSVEMMCHPAFLDNTILASKYCYPRLAEVDVLTSPGMKNAIAERGYRLGSFLDL